MNEVDIDSIRYKLFAGGAKYEYPIINYCMQKAWIEELMYVGGKVSNPSGMQDPKLVQRMIELSYLCGIAVPGTYRDADGKIRNDDFLSIHWIEGLKKWGIKRDNP
jgi:hypothetical protein